MIICCEAAAVGKSKRMCGYYILDSICINFRLCEQSNQQVCLFFLTMNRQRSYTGELIIINRCRGSSACCILMNHANQFELSSRELSRKINCSIGLELTCDTFIYARTRGNVHHGGYTVQPFGLGWRSDLLIGGDDSTTIGERELMRCFDVLHTVGVHNRGLQDGHQQVCLFLLAVNNQRRYSGELKIVYCGRSSCACCIVSLCSGSFISTCNRDNYQH